MKEELTSFSDSIDWRKLLRFIQLVTGPLFGITIMFVMTATKGVLLAFVSCVLMGVTYLLAWWHNR